MKQGRGTGMYVLQSPQSLHNPSFLSLKEILPLLKVKSPCGLLNDGDDSKLCRELLASHYEHADYQWGLKKLSSPLPRLPAFLCVHFCFYCFLSKVGMKKQQQMKFYACCKVNDSFVKLFSMKNYLWFLKKSLWIIYESIGAIALGHMTARGLKLR